MKDRRGIFHSTPNDRHSHFSPRRSLQIAHSLLDERSNRWQSTEKDQQPSSILTNLSNSSGWTVFSARNNRLQSNSLSYFSPWRFVGCLFQSVNDVLFARHRLKSNSTSSSDTGFQSIELRFRLILKARTRLFDNEINRVGFGRSLLFTFWTISSSSLSLLFKTMARESLEFISLLRKNNEEFSFLVDLLLCLFTLLRVRSALHSSIVARWDSFKAQRKGMIIGLKRSSRALRVLQLDWLKSSLHPSQVQLEWMHWGDGWRQFLPSFEQFVLENVFVQHTMLSWRASFRCAHPRRDVRQGEVSKRNHYSRVFIFLSQRCVETLFVDSKWRSGE